MYCTRCGAQNTDGSRYCTGCGDSLAVAGVDAGVPAASGYTAAGSASFAPSSGSASAAPGRRLRRVMANKKIAGVCAGFARYFDVDVVLMRVLWLGLAICSGGIGFLVYLAAWIVIPSDCGAAAREVAVVRTPQTN